MNLGPDTFAFIRFVHALGFDLYTDGRFRADFSRFQRDL